MQHPLADETDAALLATATKLYKECAFTARKLPLRAGYPYNALPNVVWRVLFNPCFAPRRLDRSGIGMPGERLGPRSADGSASMSLDVSLPG